MAQVAYVDRKPLDNLKLRKTQTFKTGTEWIYGCVITQDGKILLTDIGTCKGIFGFDHKGNHLFSISTAPNYAFDVTCIDERTVAVTSGDNDVITIIDITSRTVKKHIKVGYRVFGVTHKDGALLICSQGHGIRSVNLNNDKITTIIPFNLPSFSYVTSLDDNIYYTNEETGTVTCCDMEGNTKWAFADEAVFTAPRCITLDNTGQVFVCDTYNKTVVVLSKDGQKSRTIISKDDGIIDPYVVHFDKKQNNLVVANGYNEAFIFDVCI